MVIPLTIVGCFKCSEEQDSHDHHPSEIERSVYIANSPRQSEYSVDGGPLSGWRW